MPMSPPPAGAKRPEHPGDHTAPGVVAGDLRGSGPSSQQGAVLSGSGPPSQHGAVLLGNVEASPRKRRIVHRTAQLGVTGRILYRIEHYSSRPFIAVAVTGLVVVAVAAGAAFGFPGRFVTLFEMGVSAVTLVMVFAIQHTQGREQAATQRKLDELIRALPGADEGLMMLEEASSEALLEIEEGQREIRAAAPAADPLLIASVDHR